MDIRDEVIRIARPLEDTKLRDEATAVQRAQREGARPLAESLAAFAVAIAPADVRPA